MITEPTSFRHEALLYSGVDGFLAGTASFIRKGIGAGEPVLVLVSQAKIDLLREALDADAGSVQFADMARVGTNPARLIPVWNDFLAEHSGRGQLRGIGEPIWDGRSPEELVECQRHESLLNVAFAGSPAWTLLCPYDVDALQPAAIEEARRSHPVVMRDEIRSQSPTYIGLEGAAAPFDHPLTDPPVWPEEFAFNLHSLAMVRDLTSEQATLAGLSPAKTADLVLAVNEVATNSLVHGGGRGTLRSWQEPGALVCEILDAGRLHHPLAGRERPADGGVVGLWLVNQLCDLVQIRSFPGETVVRLRMNRPE